MPSVGSATVLIVDDDPVIRRSMSRLIRSAGYSVQTFASPADFLQSPLPAEPTCVLLDMFMDGMTGLEVQDQLRRRDRRHVPIVFLSGHATVPDAAVGFKHGAADFLEKPVRPKELIEALKRAIEGDRTQSADQAELESFRQRFEALTPREQEVMRLVVSGRLNKQAAAALEISEKTIKVHRARVMEKMRVDSLAALVLVAERLGLTPGSAALVAEPREEWAY